MHETEYIEKAGEQFLGKSEFQVKELLQQTFEGHLRAIIGTMSVEQLFQDREEFAHNVREVAATDVSKMGIKILSFTIKGFFCIFICIICFFFFYYFIDLLIFHTFFLYILIIFC